MIVAISTAKERIGQACTDSVGRGASLHLQAVGPVPALENVWNLVRCLDPWDRVCWIDGDDWVFPGWERAIETLPDDVWLSWGSYVTSDGSAGCCSWSWDRREGWGGSHLKTFKAGLFHQLSIDDLQDRGRWLTRAIDMAVMFPLREMAGDEHCRFVEDVIYVYDYRASFERNASPLELSEERRQERVIRNKPIKAKLEVRPW